MVDKDKWPQELIDFRERLYSNTAVTNNEEFDSLGYLILKDLWDPTDLYSEIPTTKGRFNYYGKINKFEYIPEEGQVNGSTSRYYWPPYKFAHSQIRKKIEKIIGKKLYNTYYFDRFYKPGLELTNHLDRPACEISVTLHIRTNLNTPWPIWIKTPDTYNNPKTKEEILKKGENRSIILKPGDAMLYKGCERPHWRKPMPGVRRNRIRKWLKMEEFYYHQIFFHYVLADGFRAHCADDRLA